MIARINRLASWFAQVIPSWMVPLLARAGVFSVFWFSVQTKNYRLDCSRATFSVLELVRDDFYAL